jgi:hypothetical protein
MMGNLLTKWLASGTLLMTLVAVVSAAPTPVPSIVLTFAGDDPGQLKITDEKGRIYPSEEGLQLFSGWTLTTAKGGSAELLLGTTGSVLKLAASTTFRIRSLSAGGDSKATNEFELAAGKVRGVMAKLTGTSGEPGYNFRTPTASAGVRGTDFGLAVNAAAGKEWLCVLEGRVDFTKTSTGETLQVKVGEFADALALEFAVAPVDAAQQKALFADLQFRSGD